MSRTPFYGPLEWFGLRYSQMYNRLARARRGDLVLWLNTIKALTGTNCWWAVYNAGQWLRPQIEMELRIRDQKIQRRLAERSIPYAFAGIPDDHNGGSSHE